MVCSRSNTNKQQGQDWKLGLSATKTSALLSTPAVFIIPASCVFLCFGHDSGPCALEGAIYIHLQCGLPWKCWRRCSPCLLTLTSPINEMSPPPLPPQEVFPKGAQTVETIPSLDPQLCFTAATSSSMGSYLCFKALGVCVFVFPQRVWNNTI